MMHSESQKRARSDYEGPSHSSHHSSFERLHYYGQELSFSILSKDEVEMKWTGRGRVNQEVLAVVNHWLRIFAPKGEFKPLPPRDRFSLSIKHYTNFVQAMAEKQIDCVRIPEAAMRAISLRAPEGGEELDAVPSPPAPPTPPASLPRACVRASFCLRVCTRRRRGN